jgi:hypothetical protein
MSENKVAWVAEVFPDWTTLQICESEQYFAFNRETGRVYALPHPDCPFIPNPFRISGTKRTTP